ncbi:MAG: archaeosortase/exosortase family protein [Candidatus Magasanikbacteria bacterium]|nr:archaeosortase/exosortase family protein [Candidatus Magasanikbacteria bacterium]
MLHMAYMISWWGMNFNEIKAHLMRSSFRLGFFLIVGLLLGFFRTWYTQYFFGYHVQTSDPIIAYFFYELVIFVMVIRWREWNRVLVEYQWGIIQFVCSAVVLITLFAPTTIRHNNDQIFLEFFITSIRTGVLFFLFLPADFIKKNIQDCELVTICTLLISLFAFFMDQLWQFLSVFILYGLGAIFHILRISHLVHVTTFEVTVKNFTVYIGSQCAGMGSMTAFLILSIATYFLLSSHGKKFSGKRMIFVCVGGLAGAFLVNFFRIFLLILIGGYFSPSFALTSFHSVAGAFLFFIFFALYMTWAVKYVMIKS